MHPEGSFRCAPETAAGDARRLRIAAVTPFTTLDFPGRLSAVVFVRGCPWKCAYCHNAWMQSREPDAADASFDEVLRLLERRRGLLDAVVFSGGEPCLDPALRSAMLEVKSRGMLVALHTGGAYPARLAEVIDLVDWVGLDVKAPPSRPALFDSVAGAVRAADHFLKSFEVIRASGVDFEARTTAHPDLLDDAALLEIARWLSERGTRSFALQIYRKPPGECASALSNVPADYPAAAALSEIKALFDNFVVRRG